VKKFIKLLVILSLGLQSTYYAMNQNDPQWPRQSNDQYIYKIDREAFPRDVYGNGPVNLGPEISVIKNNFNSGITRISITREIGHNGYIYRIMETWTTKNPSYLTWKNGALVLGTAAFTGSGFLAFKNQDAINNWWNKSSTTSTNNDSQSYFDAIKSWMPSLPSWSQNQSPNTTPSTNKNEPGYFDRIKSWMPSWSSSNTNQSNWNDEFKDKQYIIDDNEYQNLINYNSNKPDDNKVDYAQIYDNQPLQAEEKVTFDWNSEFATSQNLRTPKKNKSDEIDYGTMYENQKLAVPNNNSQEKQIAAIPVAAPVVKIVEARESQNIVTIDPNLSAENKFSEGKTVNKHEKSTATNTLEALNTTIERNNNKEFQDKYKTNS